MSDSSGTTSNDSHSQRGNERILSDSEDEASPSLPDITRKEYANYKRIVLSSSDDDDNDSDNDAESGGAGDDICGFSGKFTAKILRAIQKAFPLAKTTPDAGPSRGVGGEGDAGAIRVPEREDMVLKAILSLEKTGSKLQQKIIKSIDWRAVKEAASMDPAYRDHPEVARGMEKLRAALPKPEPALLHTANIFTHRAGVVREALRKAWELETAIDLLAPQPRCKVEKVKMPKAKREEPEDTQPAVSENDVTSPGTATAPPAKKMKKRDREDDGEGTSLTSNDEPDPHPKKKTKPSSAAIT